MRLEGKRVLVTAAAAGIGKASVLQMAAEGATVFATDIDDAGLESLAANPSITPLRLDVTDRSAIDRLASEVGPLDVLFNCAGIVPSGTILDCSVAEWQTAINVNMTSCFHMIQAFLPPMLEQRSGSIINMASIVSSLKSAPNRFSYGATKAAVIGITKAVAIDYVSHGIRCNAICPGTVDTPSLQQRLHATGDYEAARRIFEARQPMGRLARTDEITGLVIFLASDESSYITGQAYPVDGGWSL